MDEQRIVTRAIEVTWGGEPKVLPVLPMKPADEWRRLFVSKFPETDAAETDAGAALAMAAERVLDLMLAYDRSKVLGNREWIEENVTDEEIAAAFVEVWKRSFRLGRLPMDLVKSQLGQQLTARSPNGRLPAGASTPIGSVPDSPTSS